MYGFPRRSAHLEEPRKQHGRDSGRDSGGAKACEVRQKNEHQIQRAGHDKARQARQGQARQVFLFWE